MSIKYWQNTQVTHELSLVVDLLHKRRKICVLQARET